MSATIYAIVSVVIVSLISIFMAIPLLVKKQVSQKLLLFLLSASVGVLLATVFLDFLPEMLDHESYSVTAALVILLGFMVMFVLEKLVHCHHTKKCENGQCGHSHAYNLAPINLVGDGIHNFIDGIVIAGAYAANITLGITATISIIFHEIPQEIADFGVLLYSGLTKKKALVFNFLSAATAVIGTVIGLLLIGSLNGFNDFILPFAVGNFLYIAASNLLPQLHRHCGTRDSIIHVLAILLGIFVIAALTVFMPGHAHG